MLNNVLATGGGTGGHAFTGIAVLDEVRRRYPSATTGFLGSQIGHEVHLVPRAGHASHSLDVRALRLNGPRGALQALWRIPLAIAEASRILRQVRPEVVIGVGGPASGPTLIAAKMLGIPTLLHEQNAVPGLANRLAGGLVDGVLVGLPQVRGRFVARPDVVVTGNPVRGELMGALSGHRPAPDDGRRPLEVLVLGGSDGSFFLNARMPGVLARAAALAGRELRVVHQAGSVDTPALRRTYSEAGLVATVYAFTHDIGSAYRAADVAIGLAGAGTLGELALAGVPSVIVPLATAADDHQRENAYHFARNGAIRLLDEGAWKDEGAAMEVARLLGDPALRGMLTERFQALAAPAAAGAIVDALERAVAFHAIHAPPSRRAEGASRPIRPIRA